MDLDAAFERDPEYADKFAELFKSTGVLIAAHLKEHPPNRDRAYRVLNMLAAHAATVIVGTNDTAAYEFFLRCLVVTMHSIAQDKGIGPLPPPRWDDIAKPEGNG